MSWKGMMLKSGISSDGWNVDVFRGNLYARNVVAPPNNVWYVDSSVGASGNGKSWNRAFKTMAEAFTASRNYDYIVCVGSFTENLATRAYNHTNTHNYVTVIGQPVAIGGAAHGPTFSHLADGNACITLNALGWQLIGLKFYGEATNTQGAIKVRCLYDDDDNYDGSSGNIAIRTRIVNCHFWGGIYGIDLLGTPYEVDIVNNQFQLLHTGTNAARCITYRNGMVSYAAPYRYNVIGNHFMESDGYIDFQLSGSNACRYMHNIFQGSSKSGYNADPKLHLGGQGIGNTVAFNVLGDTYDNTGGYYADAGTGNWYGNACEDGFSTADPAA